MPDKTRKIQVCFPIELNSPLFVVKAAINQLNKRITLVRIAVARFELTSVTPIFAKMAVMPANNAERSAQINHCIHYGHRGGIFCLVRGFTVHRSPFALNALLGILNEIFGSQTAAIYESNRMGDIKHSCADIRLSEKLLGDYNQADIRDAMVRNAQKFCHEKIRTFIPITPSKSVKSAESAVSIPEL
jgi:hypothetical protein